MGKLRCLLIFNLQLSIKRDGFDKYKGLSSQEINTQKAPISYFLSSRQCLNHCSVYICGLPSQGRVYDACTCGQLCWVLIYPFPSGYHFLFLTWQPFYGYPENNFINKSFSLSHGEGKAMRWFSYSQGITDSDSQWQTLDRFCMTRIPDSQTLWKTALSREKYFLPIYVCGHLAIFE